MYAFPKGINAMWNANSLIQDLNLGRRVSFLWRYSLHNQRHPPDTKLISFRIRKIDIKHNIYFHIEMKA